MTKVIVCPCCGEGIEQADVWFDCACFEGRKKDCVNCARPSEARAAHIAAAVRSARRPPLRVRDEAHHADVAAYRWLRAHANDAMTDDSEENPF